MFWVIPSPSTKGKTSAHTTKKVSAHSRKEGNATVRGSSVAALMGLRLRLNFRRLDPPRHLPQAGGGRPAFARFVILGVFVHAPQIVDRLPGQDVLRAKH